MNARIRKAIATKDGGFTLIELLVVMIIIGILAAIAIPVFSSQQDKAKETALRADLSTMGKEIATDFVDDGKTIVSIVGTAAETTKFVVNGTEIPFTNTSKNVAVNIVSTSEWCIQATQEETGTTISYNVGGTAESGIHDADCPGTTTALSTTTATLP